MNIYDSELIESLRTGLVDHLLQSKEEYVPQLIVNDKINGKNVLTTIHNELSGCKAFWFSVAFVTSTGVIVLKNLLKELEEKKIKGEIMVSQYQNFTQPEALRSLLKFKNIDLRIVVKGDFHAKGYLFKRILGYDLIIGSSNLTANALLKNKEWNLKLSATNKGKLINNVIKEFKNEFDSAIIVNEKFIKGYESIYKAQAKFNKENENKIDLFLNQSPEPNKMQKDALLNLKKLRHDQKDKALLISATATGKTYLSAFDVKEFNPKRFLFIVHRVNIAAKAMLSYKKVFGNTKTMGLYSGENKDISSDFLFSTVQTISRDYNLNQFNKNHFDYIVIDETHRAGAESYQKIMKYFNPKFILGMTATPERTDGFDIFKQFDYNIAYEIRLHQALKEEMLCNFHYFGVTDISVDDKILEDFSSFKLLTANERVNRIIEKATFYGCDNGCLRGLIFCSSNEESRQLSIEFNNRGYKTVSLSGLSSEAERLDAIDRLECDNKNEKLDYIFSVDIFNEGIDIPKVNQIIMLRPTQSAIVFVQQLGRGLRKADDKEYLTVIDFIGNYSNNYLVPIALFGDTTYNRDTIRKLMTNGSTLIPGASTVNFDKIAKERIFASIDKANLKAYKDLVNDYKLLKFKIGKIPMMMDFFEHGHRDPSLYVDYSGSYFNFLVRQEDSLLGKLSITQIKLLELFSKDIANGKRIEEVIILQEILKIGRINTSNIKKIILNKYDINVSSATLESSINNLNFYFINNPQKIILVENNFLQFDENFLIQLKNECFNKFFIDLIKYSENLYNNRFSKERYINGFTLYQKYSRKDVCRILNWEKNEESTIYGYRIKYDTCPIFINYHKEEGIADSTKYEDRFVNNFQFEWISKSNRTLKSKDISTIKNDSNNLRMPLFIKKSNDEGNDFYYMGEVKPIEFTPETMLDKKKKVIPVVKMDLILEPRVEDSMYEYLTTAIIA